METLLAALGDGTAEVTEPVGAHRLPNASRDPEVKTGLGVLLALATALGRQTADHDSDDRN